MTYRHNVTELKQPQETGGKVIADWDKIRLGKC